MNNSLPHVEYGVSPSGSNASIPITFDREFQTTPTVLTTVQGNATTGSSCSAVTTKGFTLLKGSANTAVHWLAIGK